jgi:hypothetical protein
MSLSASLWTCPKCGARLVTRNLAHSCGRATLAEWQARMGPHARALYDRFEEMIAACGEYYVAPARTRIAFMALVRFAGITRLDESVMHCSFALPSPLQSTRFHKVYEVVPGWWVHELRITHPVELDREVQAWIRESYRVMGLRNRSAAAGRQRPAKPRARKTEKRPS